MLKQKRKASLTAEKALERTKGMILHVLYELQGDEPTPIYDDDGMLERWAYLKDSVSHSVDMSRVEPQYGTYILPALDYVDYSTLLKLVQGTELEGIVRQAEHKVKITDLPESIRSIKKRENINSTRSSVYDSTNFKVICYYI